MKKLAIVFCAALMALLSCQKESPEMIQAPETPETPAAKITFNLSATHPDGADTKAVKTGWETGDVIFVFFSGSTAPGYLEMKWDGSQWLFTEKNNLLLADGETGTMWAIHQPFGNDNVVTAGENGQWEFRDIHYNYFLEGRLPYTVSDGGGVSGTFDMRIPLGFVQFFLDDLAATPSRQMELRERNIIPMGLPRVSPVYGGFFTGQCQGAPMPGYVYDKENKATGEQKGWLFSGFLAHEAEGSGTDYHFTLVDGGWEGNYYSKSFLNRTYYTGEAERRALKLPAISNWISINDNKPIDLGCDYIDWPNNINKRIYWSSRNLGAGADIPAADTDAARQATWGDYYAWGATEPYYEAGHAYDNPCTHWKSGKTGYNWQSYPFMNPGASARNINKYTFADNEDDADWYNPIGQFIGDNKTVLEKGDDAASVALGGAWRMPTDAEWALLMDDAKFTRSYDPVKQGVTITSTVPGFEGRSIFLPLAGARMLNLLCEYEGADPGGYYWSSCLSSDCSSDAKSVTILNTPDLDVNNYSRNLGQSVRPVTE